MARFRVYFKTSADKIFSGLPSDLQQNIVENLFILSEDPFGRSENIKKLSGFSESYRLRVGRWRVLYTLYKAKKEIEVIDIFLKKGKEDYRRKLRNL